MKELRPFKRIPADLLAEAAVLMQPGGLILDESALSLQPLRFLPDAAASGGQPQANQPGQGVIE